MTPSCPRAGPPAECPPSPAGRGACPSGLDCQQPGVPRLAGDQRDEGQGQRTAC